MREALLFHRENGRVVCDQCAHRCALSHGEAGPCGVMINRDNVLYSRIENRISVAQISPVERRLFFHVLPNSKTLAVGAMGCNFRCPHCCTHEVSQVADAVPPMGTYARPSEIVAHAKSHDCDSITFTFNEPSVTLDLVLDVSKAARAQGLGILVVTNGFFTEAAIRALAPHVTAVNVDLKCFSQKAYREIFGGDLAPVLKSLESLRDLGVWVEATTGIIPGLTDRDEELRVIAEYLAGIDSGIPWHISSFQPAHRMSELDRSKPATLRRAVSIGRQAGLSHVYAPELMGEDGVEATFCPHCSSMLVERFGFQVKWCRVSADHCPDCRGALDGVWTRW